MKELLHTIISEKRYFLPVFLKIIYDVCDGEVNW